jgi:putative ABC transport system ATP-binding protein
MAVRVAPRPAPPVLEQALQAEPIVEARAVNKVYDTGKLQVHALQEVSFIVPRGEMVAIMGPSGSGKTTLLNCLSGLDRIDGGEVLIDGVALSAMSDEERTDYRARRMGFVFQFYNLMPVLTAVENIELPLLLTGLGRGERRERALVALRAVGLPHRADHRPQQLSGGEQQRVAIARAIVTDPDLLVADEPTGDLDARSAEDILTLLRELNRAFEKTIVMVTHDPRAERWVDTAVRLDKGILVDDGGLGTAA